MIDCMIAACVRECMHVCVHVYMLVCTCMCVGVRVLRHTRTRETHRHGNKPSKKCTHLRVSTQTCTDRVDATRAVVHANRGGFLPEVHGVVVEGVLEKRGTGKFVSLCVCG